MLVWLLLALQIKHFIWDFYYQPPYMWQNKGTFGHPGGIVHSGLHAITTFYLLFTFPVGLGLKIAADTKLDTNGISEEAAPVLAIQQAVVLIMGATLLQNSQQKDPKSETKLENLHPILSLDQQNLLDPQVLHKIYCIIDRHLL